MAAATKSKSKRKPASKPRHPDEYRAYGVRIFRTSKDFKPKALTDKLPKQCIIGERPSYYDEMPKERASKYVDKYNSQALFRGWHTWAAIGVDKELFAAAKAAAELEAAIEQVSFGWSVHVHRHHETNVLMLNVGCCIGFPLFPFDQSKPLQTKEVAEICRRAVEADHLFETPLVESVTQGRKRKGGAA